MTDKEILENNKLIAEFMGYIIEYKKYQTLMHNSSNESYWYDDEGEIVTLNSHEVSDENNEPYYNLEDLPFDCSWEWLMPVVDKIEGFNISFLIGNDGNPKLNPSASFNHNALTTIKGNIDIFTKGESKLEAVYKAVIEFIKWYNEQNKKSVEN